MGEMTCDGCKDFERNVYQQIAYTHCHRGFQKKQPFGCRFKKPRPEVEKP